MVENLAANQADEARFVEARFLRSLAAKPSELIEQDPRLDSDGQWIDPDGTSER